MKEEKRDCCIEGKLQGCNREDPCCFVVKAGREILLRLPLYCFIEKFQQFVEPEKDFESCLPGLRWSTGTGSGIWDLGELEKRGERLVFAIEISKILGGKVRDYFFPTQIEGQQITYLGEYKRAFEPPDESPDESLEIAAEGNIRKYKVGGGIK